MYVMYPHVEELCLEVASPKPPVHLVVPHVETLPYPLKTLARPTSPHSPETRSSESLECFPRVDHLGRLAILEPTRVHERVAWISPRSTDVKRVMCDWVPRFDDAAMPRCRGAAMPPGRPLEMGRIYRSCVPCIQSYFGISI